MVIVIKALFQQAIPLQEWPQALPEFAFEQIAQILEQLFVGFDLIFEMPDSAPQNFRIIRSGSVGSVRRLRSRREVGLRIHGPTLSPAHGLIKRDQEAVADCSC